MLRCGLAPNNTLLTRVEQCDEPQLCCEEEFMCSLTSCPPGEIETAAWPSVQDVAHVHIGVFAPHADADGLVANDGSLRSAPHRWNWDALHPPEQLGYPVLACTFPRLAFDVHHGRQGDSWATQPSSIFNGKTQLFQALG